MATPLSDIAYAKINLALHVRARRADGYHELETLFAFLEDGDRLTIGQSPTFELVVTGPMAVDLADEEDNLVLRAARLLAVRADVSGGASFTLDKRLPVAAGLGGGSADAAAALRLAAQLWGIDPRSALLAETARELGADVPACLASVTSFGRGVGDILTPVDLDDVKGASVLLVNPLMACPTGPVFQAWDGEDRGALDPQGWRFGRNDLQAPACRMVDEIDDVLTVLRAQLPDVARMSGSGATCFAVFADQQQRDAAAVRIADDHPDWWVMSGALR